MTPLRGPRRAPRGRAGERPRPRFRAVVGVLDADGVQALDLLLDYDPATAEIASIAPAGIAKDHALVTSDKGRRAALAPCAARPLQDGGELLEITLRPQGPLVGVPFRLDGRANEGRVPISW